MISVQMPYTDAKLLAFLNEHDVKKKFEWNVPINGNCNLKLEIVGPPSLKVNSQMIAHAIELLEMSKRSFEIHETRSVDTLTAGTRTDG